MLHAVQVFTSSFPSGHAAVSAVVYLTLGALLARDAPSIAVKIYVMAVAILIVFPGRGKPRLSRRPLSDRRARGLVYRSAWALTCWLAADRPQHRHAAKTQR